MRKRKFRFLLLDTTRSENVDYIVDRISQRADTVEEATEQVTSRVLDRHENIEGMRLVCTSCTDKP